MTNGEFIKSNVIASMVFAAFCCGAMMSEMLVQSGHRYISLILGVPAWGLLWIVRAFLWKEFKNDKNQTTESDKLK